MNGVIHRGRRTRLLLAVSAAAIFALPLLASASGELDPAFGTGGKVLTDISLNDIAYEVLLQPHGKIVAVGWTEETPSGGNFVFGLTRYATDGSIDPSFGAGGKVLTPLTGSDFAFGAALQSDGRIVVVGRAFDDFGVARYQQDGALDTGFGPGGTTVTDFGRNNDQASAVAIGADGKPVVLGSTRPPGPAATSPSDFALARYNSDGSLDTSFDGDGQVTTDFGSNSIDRGQAVAVTPDGKIVAAGFGRSGDSPPVVVIARYHADGSLDTSFDGDGKVITATTLEAVAVDVLVQPDGKIVAAGFIDVAGDRRVALFRYDTGGGLDQTFGTGGVAIADFGPSSAGAVALQPDGKIVAAGAVAIPTADAPDNWGFVVARFDASGRLDPSFYDDGHAVVDFRAGSDNASALALQADGKIVVAGYSSVVQNGQSVGSDFALARVLPSFLLEVAKAGPGSGSVSSAPAGITCGSDCSNGYSAGTAVTLTATPDAGSYFAGWGGACSGKANSCRVTVAEATSVTASFAGCEVPAVKGRRLPVARRLIAAAHCSVGKVRFKHSKRKKRLVLAQAPAAGADLPVGTRVNLMVSRGPKPKPHRRGHQR
jgi:uncharacterized delta-60 repeat protein